MKKLLFVFTSLLVCITVACVPEESDTYHKTVKVTNNADYPIYVNVYWGDGDWTIRNPWDGSANKIADGWDDDSEERVNPGETNTKALHTIRGASIEGYLIGLSPMVVYFMNGEMYDQIPVGDPLPSELFLGGRAYDLEALQAIDFHIEYPLE